MTKTIEEAANEYATNWEAKHNIHNPELYGLIVDAYKASAERIMMLPLAFRMTAEEKERARKVYRRNCAEIAKHDNDVITAHSEGVMHALELFFGADFFKEGE